MPPLMKHSEVIVLDSLFFSKEILLDIRRVLQQTILWKFADFSDNSLSRFRITIYWIRTRDDSFDDSNCSSFLMFQPQNQQVYNPASLNGLCLY